MIAKHARIRQPQRGRFGRLVQYLLDSQEKSERVGRLTVTNCYSADPTRAVLEVMNTQAQNVRAKSEKTYHLVVSFRPGENPAEAVLSAIEKTIVEGLGYSEHQRISVVHHDTDCLHIHLAINKIHPRRHTLHEPIRDYYTLGNLCAQLEKIHGLQVTNHQTRSARLQSGAAETETRSLRESLTTWLRRECAADLAGARSWEEWHTRAGTFGLTTRRRGNGLVIEAADGLAVKASAVDRAFSLAALEKRFGVFVAPSHLHVKAERQYQPRPIQADTAALYARYLQQRARHADAVLAYRWRLKSAKHNAIAAAQRRQRARRRRLRLLPPSRGRQLLYSEIARIHRRRLNGIFEQSKKIQQLVTRRYGGLAWADWLAREAAAGDGLALLALRARARAPISQNCVSAASPKAHDEKSLSRVLQVTKRGSTLIRPGIRDEGVRVTIQSDRQTRDYVELLNVAVSRYGARLRATGDERFRMQIVIAAAVSGRTVTFEDAALENRRIHLVTILESMNERKGDDGRGTDRSGTRAARGSRGTGIPGRAAGRAATTADLSGRGSWTDVIATRPIPIAESFDRLRDLSVVSVVRGTQGPAVLLPTDAHNHMGQRGPAPLKSLRRTPAVLTLKNDLAQDGAWAYADRYIAERMTTRLTAPDIPKHERHAEAGLFPFAGLRKLDGQSLALFKTARGLGVMPVSDYGAKRLRNVTLDKSVRVSSAGVRKSRSQ